MAKKKIKWKLAKGKTWRQKLEASNPSHGKIVAVPIRMQEAVGTGTMVIPRPLDVDAVMRKVSAGKLLTQSRLRAELASMSDADSACPLTTGIFVRIVAETAEEDLRSGKKRVTPYWRTIKDDGSLNDKFPGGIAAQARRLRAEGFTIKADKPGGRQRVQDFERFLIEL